MLVTYDEFDELRNQLIYSTAGALTDQSYLKGLFTSVEGLNDVLSAKAQSMKPGEWQANIMKGNDALSGSPAITQQHACSRHP